MTKSKSDTVGLSMRKKLDHSIYAAIHVMATPFAVFKHPAWMKVFTELRPDWRVPSVPTIGVRLLDDIYRDLMALAVEQIRQSGSDAMGVNGATKNQRRR